MGDYATDFCQIDWCDAQLFRIVPRRSVPPALPFLEHGDETAHEDMAMPDILLLQVALSCMDVVHVQHEGFEGLSDSFGIEGVPGLAEADADIFKILKALLHLGRQQMQERVLHHSEVSDDIVGHQRLVTFRESAGGEHDLAAEIFRGKQLVQRLFKTGDDAVVLNGLVRISVLDEEQLALRAEDMREVNSGVKVGHAEYVVFKNDVFHAVKIRKFLEL